MADMARWRDLAGSGVRDLMCVLAHAGCLPRCLPVPSSGEKMPWRAATPRWRRAADGNVYGTHNVHALLCMPCLVGCACVRLVLQADCAHVATCQPRVSARRACMACMCRASHARCRVSTCVRAAADAGSRSRHCGRAWRHSHAALARVIVACHRRPHNCRACAPVPSAAHEPLIAVAAPPVESQHTPADGTPSLAAKQRQQR